MISRTFPLKSSHAGEKKHYHHYHPGPHTSKLLKFRSLGSELLILCSFTGLALEATTKPTDEPARLVTSKKATLPKFRSPGSALLILW